MAQTTSDLVFDPEVHADMAQAEFLGAVKVAGSSAVKEDSTLEGVPGSTITFPSWNTISDLDDLTEGNPMEPEAMGHTDSEATIKEAGKAVEITDKSRLVAFGDPVGEAARQFGVLAARKVDAELILAAKTDLPTAFDTAPAAGQVISWNNLVDYAIAPFGDEFEPENFAGLYINSAQRNIIFKDGQFIDAATLGQQGTPLTRGQIGSIAGVPVFVTDRVAATESLMIRKGALGLLYKRRPIVERDRDILSRADVITTNVHYAVKRLSNRSVARVRWS